MFSGRIVGDDWQGAAFGEEVSEAVAVVGRVSGTYPRRWKRADQTGGDTYVAHLPGCQLERDNPAFGIDDGVDLGRPTASGPPDGLCRRPPFPPPAER